MEFSSSFCLVQEIEEPKEMRKYLEESLALLIILGINLI